MQWTSAVNTHMGNLRTRNEDAVFCNSHRQLWAVADGMGGHNAGDYASEVIAQALTDVDLGNDLSDCVDALVIARDRLYLSITHPGRVVPGVQQLSG